MSESHFSRIIGPVDDIIQTFVSNAGTVGRITEAPSHVAVMRGTEATFRCASDTQFPIWSSYDYEKKQKTDLTGPTCESTDTNHYVTSKRKFGSASGGCDLTVKQYSDNLTRLYECRENDASSSSYSAIMMVLGKVLNRILILKSYIIHFASVD